MGNWPSTLDFSDIQFAYFDELLDLTYQYWKEYLFNINKYIV